MPHQDAPHHIPVCPVSNDVTSVSVVTTELSVACAHQCSVAEIYGSREVQFFSPLQFGLFSPTVGDFRRQSPIVADFPI